MNFDIVTTRKVNNDMFNFMKIAKKLKEEHI